MRSRSVLPLLFLINYLTMLLIQIHAHNVKGISDYEKSQHQGK